MSLLVLCRLLVGHTYIGYVCFETKIFKFANNIWSGMPVGPPVAAHEFVEVLKKKHAAKSYKKMVSFSPIVKFTHKKKKVDVSDIDI